MMTLTRRHWIPLAGIALGVFVGAVAIIGSIRGPAGPANGFGIADVDIRPTDPGPTITFAQYNIRTGRGTDDVRDLGRIAACLKGMTVIGLNELRGSAWYGRPTDQAETLGKMMHLGYLFAPTERRFGREHFGNGLLSAIPAVSWLRVPLPQTRGHSHRNLLLTELKLPNASIRVLVTHADTHDDRDQHLAAIAAAFRTQKEPVVLLGDLNAGPEHPEIARMLADPGVVATNGGTISQELPGRVEWIIARGLKGVGTSNCDKGGSDHPRIALEVATPP